MRNPPRGYKPAGWEPTAAQAASRSGRDLTLKEALRTWQWWALWALLFLNTSAGISVISQEAPMFMEISRVTAIAAAGMVGIASIGNAVGRVFWAWLSDIVTRRYAFVLMYAIQVILFWILPFTHAPALLTVVTFLILMCYGGGFGTMPAFTADYFGARNVGPIYGLMLTAWSFASVFGPILLARLRESTGVYSGALHLIAFGLLISIVLPLVIRPPRPALVEAPV
jgi:OFA family oxalate/formate antiporter-like MFS transporter